MAMLDEANFGGLECAETHQNQTEIVQNRNMSLVMKISATRDPTLDISSQYTRIPSLPLYFHLPAPTSSCNLNHVGFDHACFHSDKAVLSGDMFGQVVQQPNDGSGRGKKVRAQKILPISQLFPSSNPDPLPPTAAHLPPRSVPIRPSVPMSHSLAAQQRPPSAGLSAMPIFGRPFPSSDIPIAPSSTPFTQMNMPPAYVAPSQAPHVQAPQPLRPPPQPPITAFRSALPQPLPVPTPTFAVPAAIRSTQAVPPTDTSQCPQPSPLQPSRQRPQRPKYMSFTDDSIQSIRRRNVRTGGDTSTMGRSPPIEISSTGRQPAVEEARTETPPPPPAPPAAAENPPTEEGLFGYADGDYGQLFPGQINLSEDEE